MSSLCKCKWHFITDNNTSKSPSPKLRKKLNPCNISFPEKIFAAWNYIKRISLRILPQTEVRASMTVETAIVLPLFCFFMLHMGSAIEMIRLHGNLEVALWNAGRQVGIYEDMLPEGENDSDSEDHAANGKLEAVILSYTYIKNQIRNQLGEAYLEQSPLEDGIDGLQFWEGMIKDDVYEITMTYQISPLLQTIGFRKFRMGNRYYGHLWNGYAIPGTEEEKAYVYVTENAEVYHTNRNCTHLSLEIHAVEAANIPGGYKACEKCIDAKKDGMLLTGAVYYICPEGEHYHSRADCPGLKRTVYRIPREEAGAYRECSRCGKTGENKKDGTDRENHAGCIPGVGKPA